MRILAALAAVTLLALAGGKSAAADAPASLAPPEWLDTPSFEDLAKVYPEDALDKGVSGRTEIACTVKPDGYLQDCTLVSETPPGAGFGQASLSIAGKFRVKPGTVKPDASGVTRIVIPIRWQMVKNPDWIERPNGDTLASYWPDSRGYRAGARVVMRCRVEADGTLSHCFISSESPLGLGFGDATLKVARHFRMRPATVDGQPVAGGVVVIPIVWKIEGDPETTGGIAGVVLTVAKGDTPPPSHKSIHCATAEAPKRMCVVHPVAWEQSPAAEEIAQILRDNKGLKGVSELVCSVKNDGRLANCAAGQAAKPDQQSAMLALSGRLRAFEATRDNDKIRVFGGQIIVIFNWDELKLEAELAHQKVR